MLTDSDREFQRRGGIMPGFIVRRHGEPTTLRDLQLAELDLDAYYRAQIQQLDRMCRFIKANEQPRKAFVH